jgi:hypothetical protein
VTAPPQAGCYQVIYADPPWRFATYSDKGKGRSAEAHYDCLTIDEIKALPVARWAARDAVLLLWATDPLLRRALEVIEAWGFTYKTVGLYWVKLNKSVAGRRSDPRFPPHRSPSATSSPVWAFGPAPIPSHACSLPAATPSGRQATCPSC